MPRISREFHVLVKPVGPICNMGCNYCYYLEKEDLFPAGDTFRMPDTLLEDYIIQHIETFTGDVIRFSWHGGEPLMAGLDFFMKVVEYQNRYYPKKRSIVNEIHTNGTLLDDRWCSFFSAEEFLVSISMDGPGELYNSSRVDKKGDPTFEKTLSGYHLLQQYQIPTEIRCVVQAENVPFPLELYRYFKALNAGYIVFIPLVEQLPGNQGKVSERSVPAEAFGEFLCAIFDEWRNEDEGKVKVQIFEEAMSTAFGLDHSLCIFKTICGGVPVLEHNGDLFSCDFYVDDLNRIGNVLETPLLDLLDSQELKTFGRAKLGTLPRYCLECGVRSMCGGECPKNRFIQTPSGEEGLNYLCAGYKKFFSHCRPYVMKVADEWQQGKRR